MVSSAIAANAVGRTGVRGVESGSAAIGTPCRDDASAAICRWQFRPWQRPIVARVKVLTTLMSGEAFTGRGAGAQ